MEVRRHCGLSLGEYTALVRGASVCRWPRVKRRGEAMRAADVTPSGMVSVIGMELPQVEALVDARCGHSVSGQFVVPK